jgi:hypothetical protein
VNLGTLIRVAAAALLIRAAAAPAGPAPWASGVILDTDGHPVNAHSAGILRHGGTYYLYGEIKNGPTTLVTRVGWECYRVQAGGVSCYASTDLVHWRNLGTALAPVPGDPNSDLNPARVIERPKVVYNDRTGMFVMWMHVDSDDYLAARAGVAVSDRPEGPFRYLGSLRPNGAMARDLTLFKDDDGRAYLIFSSEDNQTLHVVLLADDYLSPTRTESRALSGLSREAPAVFKCDGTCYLVTSGCTGWSANPAAYATAASPLGPWVQHGNPCEGPGSGTTYGAQSTFVLPLDEKRGEFLFMADVWNKTDLRESRYLWLPLRVSGGAVRISESP